MPDECSNFLDEVWIFFKCHFQHGFVGNVAEEGRVRILAIVIAVPH